MKQATKLIIFSAPSGSGKSTIIQRLLQEGMPLEFSVSATSRPPRGKEKNGVEYWFLSPEEFRRRIAEGAFLEYEEVYKDRYYGTLKSEVERIAKNGNVPVFDVDVKGGLRIKEFYGKRALAVFIQPPSLEELRRRLECRGTETAEVIAERLSRAEFELSQSVEFDKVVVNDNLEEAVSEVRNLVENFLS
ncbi:MAG: guanylate kinase [Paludibacteraceae bacterium]|nr:guanylate kinase [Paludibacteraceae bacterium]